MLKKAQFSTGGTSTHEAGPNYFDNEMLSCTSKGNGCAQTRYLILEWSLDWFLKWSQECFRIKFYFRIQVCGWRARRCFVLRQITLRQIVLMAEYQQTFRPDGRFVLKMATCGNFWNLVATFGNLWQLLADCGNFWQLVVAFGTLWQLLAHFGNLWQLLATFGGFW